MKNLTILFAFAFSILATAQQQKPEKLTLSQRATLQAKKMQLALDLTDKQTNKLVNIFKSNPKPRSKNKSDIHASETNYQKQLNRLNQQLLIQKEIKSILTDTQYETWKKNQFWRRNRMAHHSKGPRPPHRNRKHQ